MLFREFGAICNKRSGACTYHLPENIFGFYDIEPISVIRSFGDIYAGAIRSLINACFNVDVIGLCPISSSKLVG